MASIKETYLHILNKNNIKLNSAQEKLLLNFSKLHQTMTKFQEDRDSLIKKLLKSQTIHKSIYLWGNVGTGKTMLTDLFFENLNTKNKQKIHFHSFMLEVHGFIHRLKNLPKANKTNPLKQFVNQLKDRIQILYIDELYINDITDAMIVGKLFKELIDAKIIIIITSNFAPEELYKDGLQRESFLPFIDLIKAKMEVIAIDSDFDFRAHKLKSVQTTYYMYKDIADSRKFIQDSFKKLSNGAPVTKQILNVNGRELVCHVSSLDCVVFNFDQLCKTPLASSDYIEICEKFHVIILSEIPELSPEEHNELRRFITLIDTIYEYKRLFICSAKTNIDSIYKSGKWHFEFKRTASRLKDMQSEDYLKHINR